MSTLFLYILANNLALGSRYTLITTSILLSIALKTFTQRVLPIILLRLKKFCGSRDLKHSCLAAVYTPL